MPISLKLEVPKLEDLEKKYQKLGKGGIGKVTQQAMDQTVYTLHKSLPVLIEKNLHNPTSFLKRAWLYKKTRIVGRNLEASVFAKNIHKPILNKLIRGGIERRESKAIYVPAKNVRLNKHGNIPGLRSKIKQAIAGSDKWFLGTIGETTGLWNTKPNMPPRLYALRVDQRSYDKGTLPFFKLMQRNTNKVFPRFFRGFLEAQLDRR